MEKRQRIEELVELLNKANYAYEQENREIMSNFEYDALYDELKALEEETGFVMAQSPTVNAGYEVLSELPKERHVAPMLSLDKTKDVDALAAFLGDKEGILSWKMDGLTNVITYENGELVKALTRGNGEIGENITNNAKVYKNIPVKIPYKGQLVLRGESIITYSEFERINAEIEDVTAKYKNPRNLCSGSVRQLNNKITAERNVLFYVYSLISVGEDMVFATRSEQLEWIKSLGFTCVEQRKVTADTVHDAVRYFAGQVANNDFPSDGLVLCFDDVAYSKSLGRTAKFPRDSIAFKWKDETAKTKLVEIEWSASRTGLINPVAIFEPVELEGTTVSRASIHNVSIMESLELGLGDEIEVYKANMIIPQIAVNHTKSGTAKPPCECPVCGKETKVSTEGDVKVLYCMNPDCLAKKIKSFSLFVSRDAMNMEGLSEATMEKWINEGFLTEPADLFQLAKHKDAIVNMEGFGEKSYENLTASIEKARTTTAERLLYAIGIPNIGVATAKLITKAFDGDMEKIRHAEVAELTEISGIGEVMAKGYADYFAKEENQQQLDHILAEVKLEKTESTAEATLEGKTFVVTGSVFQFKNRNELKAYIEERGGKVAGSVSKNTDYLINNDNMSSSSKNKTAKELGIPIITEEEFLAMVE
ncbi:MAG: NAD-dependent DNA ligase LigA [Lachnospiraceae bacterium]|nr:NAD-dependent DNA ligase LigA [Lachnospiraceae bacterium]MBP3568113.1 NAD-dependent DNA ligase LigA [Lachnospiraceae bacterium]